MVLSGFPAPAHPADQRLQAATSHCNWGGAIEVIRHPEQAHEHAPARPRQQYRHPCPAQAAWPEPVPTAWRPHRPAPTTTLLPASQCGRPDPGCCIPCNTQTAHHQPHPHNPERGEPDEPGPVLARPQVHTALPHTSSPLHPSRWASPCSSRCLSLVAGSLPAQSQPAGTGPTTNTTVPQGITLPPRALAMLNIPMGWCSQ